MLAADPVSYAAGYLGSRTQDEQTWPMFPSCPYELGRVVDYGGEIRVISRLPVAASLCASCPSLGDRFPGWDPAPWPRCRMRVLQKKLAVLGRPQQTSRTVHGVGWRLLVAGCTCSPSAERLEVCERADLPILRSARHCGQKWAPPGVLLASCWIPRVQVLDGVC